MTQAQTEAPAAVPPVIPNDSTFGMRLAMVRQYMRWGNVAEAARECGVPTDSWRNWEEGMEPRRLVTISMAISSRTGIDPDWLIRGRLPGAQPNASYDTLEDLISPPPHPALQQRVLERREVIHHDGRRKLPVGQKNRTSHPGGHVRRQTPSVSLPAVA